MKNTLTALTLVSAMALTTQAQEREPDTVIVPLAETSKIIFTIKDRSDIETLRHYNFQALFEEMLDRLEESDTIPIDSSGHITARQEDEENWNTSPSDNNANEGNAEERWRESQNNNDDDDDNDDNYDGHQKWENSRRGRIGRTWQSTNVDFGTNNFLADKQFPDGSELYAVRPWGSWYVGINSVQRTRLGKNAFVEWGLGVSWYNFKFQEHNVLVEKDELGVHFVQDPRDVEYIKSKLSATFINASLIPVLDFGDHSRKRRMWDGHGSEFRIGFGPYVGYRISSKSKLVYKEDGDRETEKNRDSFYLNNLRYGLRLQLGLRSTDLFINYDMNELFAKDKGPKLNAVSFGFIF
jgi:hypothetical protein